MTLSNLWGVTVRTYAILGITLAPVFAFGSYFVARNNIEILFAAGQLLMVLPFCRMFCHRRWAAGLVCSVGWAFCGYWLLQWGDFDPPTVYPAFVVALLPTLLLVAGKHSWRSGF